MGALSHSVNKRVNRERYKRISNYYKSIDKYRKNINMSDYNLNTPEFTAAFVNVWSPKKKDKPEDKDKFGVTMLFSAGETLSAIKQIAKQVLVDKFGADQTQWPTNAGGTPLRMPWRDQKEKSAQYEGFVDGNLFCNASTARKPGVVDNNVQDIMQQSQVYSGCRMVANVGLFYYDHKGNKGVAIGLNHLMKIADGEPLGGGAPAVASVFSPVAVDASKSAGAVFDAEPTAAVAVATATPAVDPFA